VENERPIVIVDEHFTAAEAAEAIIYEARNGWFADSLGVQFKLDDAQLGDTVKKYREMRRRSLKEAAAWASGIAEIYYSGLASVGTAGDAVVTLADVAENGVTWQTAVAGLPFVFFLRGGIKSLSIDIPLAGAQQARRVKIPDRLVKEFQALDIEDQIAVVQKAAQAGSKQDVPAILEREIVEARKAATARRGAGAKSRMASPRSERLPRPRGRIPGRWVKKNEAMSARARAYQSQITGRSGEVYVIGDAEYDGLVDGVLVEAKGPGFLSFLDRKDFKRWFQNKRKIIEQAQRQSQAVRGIPLEWHVAEPELKKALEALFKRERIIGIKIIHTPAM
jgi:hypothetical protein